MNQLPPPIRSTDYNPVTCTLYVRFRVGSYEFAKVPQTTAAKFIAESVSVGGEGALDAFHSLIEGKFKSTRTGD